MKHDHARFRIGIALCIVSAFGFALCLGRGFVLPVYADPSGDAEEKRECAEAASEEKLETKEEVHERKTEPEEEMEVDRFFARTEQALEIIKSAQEIKNNLAFVEGVQEDGPGNLLRTNNFVNRVAGEQGHDGMDVFLDHTGEYYASVIPDVPAIGWVGRLLLFALLGALGIRFLYQGE